MDMRGATPASVLNTLDSLSLKGCSLVDDRSDKLVSHIAVLVVVIFAIIAGVHEYSGTTIDCLSHSKDKTITASMKSHINNFCLTQTLYYYHHYWNSSKLPALNNRKTSASSLPENLVLVKSRSTEESSARNTEATVGDSEPKSFTLREQNLIAKPGSGPEDKFFAFGEQEDTTTTKPTVSETRTQTVNVPSSITTGRSFAFDDQKATTTESTFSQIKSVAFGKQKAVAIEGSLSEIQPFAFSQQIATTTKPDDSDTKTLGLGELQAFTTEPSVSETRSFVHEKQKQTTETQGASDKTPFALGHQHQTTEEPSVVESRPLASVEKKITTTNSSLSGVMPIVTGDLGASTVEANVWDSGSSSGRPISTQTGPFSSSDGVKPQLMRTGPSVVTCGGETVYATEINHLITVVFFLQAVCLKLPRVLWKELLERAGANIQTMVRQLLDEQHDEGAKREVAISKLATTLSTSSRKTAFTACRGQLFTLYMLVKVLYIVILVLQFWFLSVSFGIDFLQFGYSVIRTNLLKHPTSYITDFPSVVLCHFRSPTLHFAESGVWVQCVLVFNPFLHNMLLIEWVGLVLLMVITFLSILVWLRRHFYDLYSTSFLTDLLAVGLAAPSFSRVQTENGDQTGGKRLVVESGGDWNWEEELRNREKVDRFVREFLGADGVFLFRIIRSNTNTVLTAELARELYKIFSLYDSDYVRLGIR